MIICRISTFHIIRILKKHSGSYFFCSVFSQKFLTDLKTNFTKFELSTTFRSQNTTLDLPLERLFVFPLKNFVRLAITNKFRK